MKIVPRLRIHNSFGEFYCIAKNFARVNIAKNFAKNAIFKISVIYLKFDLNLKYLKRPLKIVPRLRIHNIYEFKKFELEIYLKN